MPTSHPFFIRLKDNRLVAWHTRKRPLKDFFDHLNNDEERTLYTKINQLHLMIVGKKIKGEFVIICSNVQNPTRVLKTYKERWNVETCFKNIKRHGFNLENTHMTILPRLMKLMAAIAVAILVTSLAGLMQKCAYKQTTRSPLYSLFTRGLRFLKYRWRTFNIYHYLTKCLALLKSEG